METVKYTTKRPKAAVSAVIKNSEGKILITLRSKEVLWPGTWCLPGGHLEGGQDWRSALDKEVLEEVGLVVKEAVLMGIYSDPKVNIIFDPKKSETHCFVTACFMVTKFEGEVRHNSEVDEVRWIAAHEIPESILDAELVKVRDAFQFKGEVFVK